MGKGSKSWRILWTSHKVTYMALCSSAADDPLVADAAPALGDDLVEILGAHIGSELRSGFL